MDGKCGKMALTSEYARDTIAINEEKKHRCPWCDHLFFVGEIERGTIETKCTRCKNKTKIRFI